MKKLTIFTPTYNRDFSLPQLYTSLCMQTNLDFVWLVVDDGSIDSTEELLAKWIAESRFEIQYYKQPNGGKMRAHNKGVAAATTELFFCVDSDDYLTNFAVDHIIKFWDSCSDKKKLSGMVAYSGTTQDSLIGNEFPGNITRSTLRSLYSKGFKGDTSLIFKTEVLKEFPFPEINGEKFITESVIYDRIDQLYEFEVFREILKVCEYLDDGYSKNAINLVKNNPIGWSIYYGQRALLATSLKDRFYNLSHYISYCKLAKMKYIIANSNLPFLCTLFYPIGLILYKKRKRQFNDFTEKK